MDTFFNKIVDHLPKFDLLSLGGDDNEEYQFQTYTEQNEEDLQEQEMEREKNFDEEIYITHLKQKLINLFKQDEGKKILLMDKRLHSLFDMIVRSKRINESKKAGFQDFKFETGIEDIGYLTNSYNINPNHDRIHFFIYPNLSLMQKIKSIVLNDQQKSLNRKYTCIMVPRISTICQQHLYGVESNITLKSFNFDLIPFGQDLFSLEIQNPFQQIYFDKEQSVFQLIADSLLRIQYLYGSTNNIFGIGNAAKTVEQVLNQKKKQHLIQDEAVDYKTLESIIIIDRTSDLSTPLYTPITYQALLDEEFGIQMNQINIKQQIIDESVQDETKMTSIFMNPFQDAIFASISNQTLPVAIQTLNQKRMQDRELLQKFQTNVGFSGLTENESKQIRKIMDENEMAKIEHHTYLITHLMGVQRYGRNFELETSIQFPLDPNDISDVVKKLEMLILFEYPIQEVLRLFCLLCQVQYGLKEKVYDSLRKLIIQQYGIEHLATLNRLESLGFLKKYTTNAAKDEWNNLTAKLELINEKVDEENPDDISYVYIAYAPISVRLVQQTFKKGQWKEIEKELKLLGNYFMPKDLNPKAGVRTDKKKLVIVYYIGGVSYGEVAALRLLGKLHNKEIVICTTNIINSKTIFKEAMAGFADI